MRSLACAIARSNALDLATHAGELQQLTLLARRFVAERFVETGKVPDEVVVPLLRAVSSSARKGHHLDICEAIDWWSIVYLGSAVDGSYWVSETLDAQIRTTMDDVLQDGSGRLLSNVIAAEVTALEGELSSLYDRFADKGYGSRELIERIRGSTLTLPLDAVAGRTATAFLASFDTDAAEVLRKADPKREIPRNGRRWPMMQRDIQTMLDAAAALLRVAAVTSRVPVLDRHAHTGSVPNAPYDAFLADLLADAPALDLEPCLAGLDRRSPDDCDLAVAALLRTLGVSDLRVVDLESVRIEATEPLIERLNARIAGLTSRSAQDAARSTLEAAVGAAEWGLIGDFEIWLVETEQLVAVLELRAAIARCEDEIARAQPQQAASLSGILEAAAGMVDPDGPLPSSLAFAQATALVVQVGRDLGLDLGLARTEEPTAELPVSVEQPSKGVAELIVRPQVQQREAPLPDDPALRRSYRRGVVINKDDTEIRRLAEELPVDDLVEFAHELYEIPDRNSRFVLWNAFRVGVHRLRQAGLAADPLLPPLPGPAESPQAGVHDHPLSPYGEITATAKHKEAYSDAFERFEAGRWAEGARLLRGHAATNRLVWTWSMLAFLRDDAYEEVIATYEAFMAAPTDEHLIVSTRMAWNLAVAYASVGMAVRAAGCLHWICRAVDISLPTMQIDRIADYGWLVDDMELVDTARALRDTNAVSSQTTGGEVANAKTMFELGDVEGAVRVLENLLTVTPTSPGVMLLFRIARVRGDLKLARRVIDLLEGKGEARAQHYLAFARIAGTARDWTSFDRAVQEADALDGGELNRLPEYQAIGSLLEQRQAILAKSALAAYPSMPEIDDLDPDPDDQQLYRWLQPFLTKPNLTSLTSRVIELLDTGRSLELVERIAVHSIDRLEGVGRVRLAFAMSSELARRDHAAAAARVRGLAIPPDPVPGRGPTAEELGLRVPTALTPTLSRSQALRWTEIRTGGVMEPGGGGVNALLEAGEDLAPRALLEAGFHELLARGQARMALELYERLRGEVAPGEVVSWNVACAAASAGDIESALAWFSLASESTDMDPAETFLRDRDGLFRAMGASPPERKRIRQMVTEIVRRPVITSKDDLDQVYRWARRAAQRSPEMRPLAVESMERIARIAVPALKVHALYQLGIVLCDAEEFDRAVQVALVELEYQEVTKQVSENAFVQFVARAGEGSPRYVDDAILLLEAKAEVSSVRQVALARLHRAKGDYYAARDALHAVTHAPSFNEANVLRVELEALIAGETVAGPGSAEKGSEADLDTHESEGAFYADVAYAGTTKTGCELAIHIVPRTTLGSVTVSAEFLGEWEIGSLAPHEDHIEVIKIDSPTPPDPVTLRSDNGTERHLHYAALVDGAAEPIRARFDPGQPAPDDLFVGRSREFDELKGHYEIHRGVRFLGGPRQVGKTSLLLHLQAHTAVAGSTARFIFIDGENDIALDEPFLSQIARHLTRKLGDALLSEALAFEELDHNRTKGDFLHWYHNAFDSYRLSGVVVVCIDEFQVLAERYSEEQLDAAASMIRGLSSDPDSPLRFLLAGSSTLLKVQQALGPRLLAPEITEIRLGQLGPQDVNLLVIKGFEATKVTVASAALQTFYDWSAGYPNHVHKLGQQVAAILQDQGSRIVSDSDVEDATKYLLSDRDRVVLDFFGREQQRAMLAGDLMPRVGSIIQEARLAGEVVDWARLAEEVTPAEMQGVRRLVAVGILVETPAGEIQPINRLVRDILSADAAEFRDRQVDLVRRSTFLRALDLEPVSDKWRDDRLGPWLIVRDADETWHKVQRLDIDEAVLADLPSALKHSDEVSARWARYERHDAMYRIVMLSHSRGRELTDQVGETATDDRDATITIMSYVKTVAQIVQELHLERWVHGNLSPASIYWDPRLHGFVTDTMFGNRIGERGELTRMRGGEQHPEEQARRFAEGAGFDPADDVFVLGSLIYWALDREHRYPHGLRELGPLRCAGPKRLHTSDDLTRPGIDGSLRRIIDAALAPQASRIPLDQLGVDLQDWLERGT